MSQDAHDEARDEVVSQETLHTEQHRDADSEPQQHTAPLDQDTLDRLDEPT